MFTFSCFALHWFKAWEMLMNSAFHQDATRQEIGLHQLTNKEMPNERRQSFLSQWVTIIETLNINLINCRDLVSADNKGLTTHLHDRVFIAGIYLYSVPLCLICFASHEKLSRYSVLRKSIWAAIYLYFLCYRMVFLSMQV